MFSRIRNHEKLVENGDNPSIVARKTKEGTYEKDHPALSKKTEIREKLAIVEKKGNMENAEMIVEGGENTDLGDEITKSRRPKNGTYDIEYNVSDIVYLHSYVDPKKSSRKGKKGKQEEEEQEEVLYEGERVVSFVLLILHQLLPFGVTSIL